MISQQVCEEILLEHGVRPTANRIVVVKALADAERPLSLSELEYKIMSIDKSGVFRALTLFREHHLVHVIEDGGDDDDQHVHFYCEHCHRTFCIKDMPIPPILLPEGYRMYSINYMAKGLCPQCAAEK